jgi:hypothetical protein
MATPVTIADGTGNGTASAVGTAGQTAHWIQFTAASTNTSTIRVGDANISASRGTILGSGVSASNLNYVMPVDGVNPDYQLSQVFWLAATGDKISITYGA